ncbi:MAG TPA: hypothetical protein VHF22_11990 [Planctomycetota bacterium]|nr:hypothetical protein [Planctomycetota bacterium]
MVVRVLAKDQPIEHDMIVLEYANEEMFWASGEDDWWEFAEGTLYMHSPVSRARQTS